MTTDQDRKSAMSSVALLWLVLAIAPPIILSVYSDWFVPSWAAAIWFAVVLFVPMFVAFWLDYRQFASTKR